MASFATLWSELKLDISDFAGKLNDASKDVRRFNTNGVGKTAEEMKELTNETYRWGVSIKNVSRIVSGILISQAFYSMLRDIRGATDAVWEFTKQLEYAHIAYSNLFSDTALAKEFINVLKDFAALTPFSFTDAEAATKRLLAYGIQSKNVMYVMQGIMAAASAQGDSTKIEAISRAIGQIYTYGKLMTAEVRQLTEAGIPVYDILQEKLGLTQEQLRNLGHEAIPASEAINALIDGMNERFGGIVDASSKTLQGMISNIKDNAVMLGAGLFEPVADAIKFMLSKVGAALFSLREAFETSGAGGVFEMLFPPEMHSVLRQAAANVLALGQAFIRLGGTLLSLLKPVLGAIIMLLNTLAPALTTVVNVISTVIGFVTGSAQAMKVLASILAVAGALWVAYTVKAIASSVAVTAITMMSKALAGLATMLNFIVAHPVWALLIGLTGVIVGLSVGFGNLSAKVNGFFKKLTEINGFDPDKLLLPSQKERANDLDKFNKKLGGTSDAMEDLADSTGKATKAAKGLLSFDEVFKLNEPDEGTDRGIQVPEIEIPDIGGGLGEAILPDIPDFTGFATNYVIELIKSLKDKILSAGIGAIIGGLIGLAIGGPLGAKIGAAIGAFAGLFWNKIADMLGLTGEQKAKAGITAGIGTVLGAAIGAVFGGPAGAKIGAIVGTLVGSVWGLIAQYFGVTDGQQITSAIVATLQGALIGAFSFIKQLVINLVPTYIDDAFAGFSTMAGFSLKSALSGALKQGIAGALIGLTVGLLSNLIVAWIAKELELTEQDINNSSVGQTIGGIVGALVGLIWGPIGSLVGGAIGTFIGSLVGLFWEYIPTHVKIGGIVGYIVEYWDEIVAFFEGLPARLEKASNFIGSIGIAIGEGIASVLNPVLPTLTSAWETVTGWFNTAVSSVVTFVDNIGTTIADIASVILAPFSGIFEAISTVMTDIWTAITTIWNDIFTAVSTVVTDIWTAITTVWNDVFTAVSTVLTDIWTAITTVWTDVSVAVTTVVTEIFEVISGIFYLIRDLILKVLVMIWNDFITWFNPILDEVTRVVTEIWNAISTWFTETLNTITEIVTEIWNTVSTWFTNVLNDVTRIVTSIWNAVSTWFTSILNEITRIVTSIWTTVSSWFTRIFNEVARIVKAIWSTVSPILANIYNGVRDAVVNMYNAVREKVSDVYNTVKNYFSSTYEAIKGSVSSWYTSVKDGISNIYNEFKKWITNLWDNVFGKFFDWIDTGIDKLREFFGLGEQGSTNYSMNSDGTISMSGHAGGGIFNREHIARFAEGNKAEAVIPLENASAMQPFVDAISNGIVASLAPMFAGGVASTQPQQMQPLYVGTLIADDRGLKELERRMEVIRLQEHKR